MNLVNGAAISVPAGRVRAAKGARERPEQCEDLCTMGGRGKSALFPRDPPCQRPCADAAAATKATCGTILPQKKRRFKSKK